MSLKTDIDQLAADAAIMHAIVQGPPALVSTAGGNIKSLALAVGDLETSATASAAAAAASASAASNSAASANTSAGTATTKANEAAASATAAANVAGAGMWASGSYTAGNTAWSPLNFITYRCINTGSRTIDPSLDPTNWASVAITPAGVDIKIESFYSRINDIGKAGHPGFAVGICPALPAGFTVLPGTNFPSSDQYGNYQFSDGSIMVWVPAYYYKYGTGANGLAVNVVSVKAEWEYATVAAANADGYALHRAFYDNGAVQRGVFVDKYKCSNNAGTASSIKLGIPLSSSAANAPFSGLTGAPANSYYGAIAAAKTRGANFFSSSLFIRAALALLSLAHAQASTSTTYCAWYSSGSTNFPKGCNNNALGDAQDGALTFTGTGYLTTNKTGSANVLAKTTHNGQNCGVADVNGTIWEICLGITSDAANIYILKPASQMKAITAGNTLATDAWGATGIAALYDNLGTTFGALWATGVNRTTAFGAATQVFDAAINGNAWNATGAGVPLAGGVGGTNAFGNDGLWDYKPNEMCPISGGGWDASSSAGAWALYLGYGRGTSYNYVGFRAALYL